MLRLIVGGISSTPGSTLYTIHETTAPLEMLDRTSLVVCSMMSTSIVFYTYVAVRRGILSWVRSSIGRIEDFRRGIVDLYALWHVWRKQGVDAIGERDGMDVL